MINLSVNYPNDLKSDSLCDNLQGIGKSRMLLLNKLGIYTLSDLVSYYPRDYQYRGDISKAVDARHGKRQSFILKVCSPFKSERIFSRKTNRSMEIQKFTACDDTASINIVFFNSPFLSTVFTQERQFRFYGEIKSDGLFSTLTCPSYESYDNPSSVKDYVPVYALTDGITPKILSSAIKQALEVFKDSKYDLLSERIRNNYSLCSYYEALCNIHFPNTKQDLDKARKRLAFEELYNFQKNILQYSNRQNTENAYRLVYPDMKEFTAVLPFTLTYQQKKAIQDLLIDMTGTDKPGSKPDKPKICAARRLVQGDVASGKTMVAAGAMFAVARNHYQSALMVPTSILATQHYNTLKPIFDKLNIRCDLLLGSMAKAHKKKIYDELKNGNIDIIIGTHALISDGVEFNNLALVITDEQHRFGVEQRKLLQSSKSFVNYNGKDVSLPHVLAMSATPIPRSLSLVMYGDLDISIINTLPPGRLPVRTFACSTDQRQKVYSFIKSKLDQGRQAYIVCPLIEPKIKEDDYIPYLVINSEDDKKSVIEYSKVLQSGEFSNYRIGVLHGKTKPSDKEKIMQDFENGMIDILVSTTVIEVGVNVPNAQVILIENAEKYGLSQLHQLRGRVCRGNSQPYCVLMSPKYDNNNDSVFKQRMDIMCQSNDGFYIAQKDLELRGPGEFFGKRQHGELKFKIADIACDSEIILNTRKAVMEEL